jgi:hypothetical protein
MPKITSTPSPQTIYNRRWRDTHSKSYDEYNDATAVWNNEKRRFLRILDIYSDRRPQGRPRKTPLVV